MVTSNFAHIACHSLPSRVIVGSNLPIRSGEGIFRMHFNGRKEACYTTAVTFERERLFMEVSSISWSWLIVIHECTMESS